MQFCRSIFLSIFFAYLGSNSLNAFASSVVPLQFGANDEASARAIDTINQRNGLREAFKHAELANNLRASLKQHSRSSYAHPRLLNELAELLSHQIFDIEAAIEIDKELLSTSITDQDQNDFLPRHEVALGRKIHSKYYMANYIRISGAAIVDAAKQRLEVNTKLLEGALSTAEKKYSREFLEGHLSRVKRDLKTSRLNTTDRKSILSRAIRAEYEISNLDPSYRLTGHEEFSNGFSIFDIDYSEISYLQLAQYLTAAFHQTKNIRYAELALNSIYRPYINLRSSEVRWRYNKLVNQFVSDLINANFNASQFDEMLYYATLNKSRMLLEERLAFADAKGTLSRLADITPDDGIPRTPFGLPDKTWFKSKLAGTSHFLDFYVGGAYSTQTIPVVAGVGRTERSVMPLNSRNSARIKTDEPIDAFVDNSLYITQVRSGNVAAIKVDGGQLTQLRREMEQAYEAISNTRAATLAPSLQRIKAQLQLPDNLTVSPDKWIAAHPLDFHLQAKVVRSVNFFTSGSSDRIGQIRVAGFFNPTLDLAGADSEADYIKTLIPTATIVRREAARKSAIKDAVAANVIHLSMHGVFNATDPTMSKLVFAGAKNDDSTDDPSALYANEMISMPALRNRDLVFAAACQTGLAAADRTNSNELIGILRPLTASRNKNIILSLWNVSDAATGEFVKAFYSNLATSQDVKASFHYAQDQLKSQYPHPYYWAAFYLSQAN